MIGLAYFHCICIKDFVIIKKIHLRSRNIVWEMIIMNNNYKTRCKMNNAGQNFHIQGFKYVQSPHNGCMCDKFWKVLNIRGQIFWIIIWFSWFYESWFPFQIDVLIETYLIPFWNFQSMLKAHKIKSLPMFEYIGCNQFHPPHICALCRQSTCKLNF